jgi:hypothetical protein
MNLAALDSILEDRVKFGRRLLIYLFLWLLAALACAFLPFYSTVGTDSPFILRILGTPFVVVIGLAHAATWPSLPPLGFGLAAYISIILTGVFALAIRRRSAFILLACFHVFWLVVGIIYFCRAASAECVVL